MKKTIIALTIIPTFAFAITAEQQKSFNQSNFKELRKLGLPTPESGVQLVPKESLQMQDWQKKKLLADNKEMERNGYVNQGSNRAHQLMNIQAMINKVQPENIVIKPTDTYMRKNSEEIPFSYTFIGVPKNEIIEYFGIAPSGTYVQAPQSGWTGAVEFFKSSFAHCAYTESNMIASHGAAFIAEEMTRYDINGKITLIDVEGNESTGFLYRVNWFDKIFNRNIECATKEFSEATRNATIELAKKIDMA